MRGLSKSKYTLFRQCGKALWLQAYRPEEAVIDSALQARFEAGNEVGDLAMGLLGPYVEVTVHKEDGSLDLAAMIVKTQECLASGVGNIAEASFSWDGNYCAVDILHKTAEGYAIYEVKSSSGSISQSETDEEYVKYARDIAYQKYVLTKCGINVTGTYLVRINKDYVLDGDLDIHQLFYVANLEELVAQEYQAVEANVHDAKAILAMASEPAHAFGECCHKPYKCAFWKYCTKALPSPNVFDLSGGLRFNTKLKHYNNGLVSFDDLRSADLSAKPKIQVESHFSGVGVVDKAKIREFLGIIRYPLYFLDFESQQPVIPIYQGTHPYQQIPFQYSLHNIEQEGGPLLHKEFLAVSGEDPLRGIAESLVHDIPKGACVTAYNKTFECTRIKELADMFKDLEDHLLDIKENIVDLMVPFAAMDYYLPAMAGSYSIKYVLPALFPDDPSLDYHNLAGDVRNGGDAMTIFPKIKDMSPEDQTIAREALLRYCELDTYAMVKVWEKLREVSE